MRVALIIFGILAAVAVAIPDLVVLGFFLLIVPGLVLLVSPTVFVYLAAATLIRTFLPIQPGALRTLAGLGIALLIGGTVMQPFRIMAMRDFQKSLLPEIAPSRPLTLRGNVRIESIGRSGRDVDASTCEYLCAALLELPGVRSVTRAGQDLSGKENPGIAYRLLPAEASDAPGLFPNSPGALLRHLPGKKGRLLLEQEAAWEADWALRLAGAQRLVSGEPVPEKAADWTLRHTYQSGDGTNPKIWRVEIFDATGECRYRKSYVEKPLPAPVFYLDLQGTALFAGSSGRFRIARWEQRDGTRELESRSESFLLEAVSYPAPQPRLDAVQDLKAAVRAALADPAAHPAQLQLANRWLEMRHAHGKQLDEELLARIAADPRVEDATEALCSLFRGGKAPASLRNALAERIVMEATEPLDRRRLAEHLAKMPPGTFANPSPVHLALWTDPAWQREATPFLARIADLGGERALPVLRAAMEEASAESWAKRRPVMEAVRDALTRLGPEAAPLVPRIRELFLLRPSPLMQTSNEADAWRVALVRMGVAFEDLPYFPNQDEKQRQRIERAVRQKLERYEKELQAETPAREEAPRRRAR